MRPRADDRVLDGSVPIATAAYVREMPYSRYPSPARISVSVLGFVHVRDLLDIRDPKARTVADVTREGLPAGRRERQTPDCADGHSPRAVE